MCVSPQGMATPFVGSEPNAHFLLYWLLSEPLLSVQALKILSRRQDNRQRCGGHTFQTLMPFCSTKQLPAVASEAANAALNLAYEPQNVAHLVRCKGELALLQLLANGEEEVLANAAGAVQTVCYQVRALLQLVASCLQVSAGAWVALHRSRHSLEC